MLSISAKLQLIAASKSLRGSKSQRVSTNYEMSLVQVIKTCMKMFLHIAVMLRTETNRTAMPNEALTDNADEWGAVFGRIFVSIPRSNGHHPSFCIHTYIKHMPDLMLKPIAVKVHPERRWNTNPLVLIVSILSC